MSIQRQPYQVNQSPIYRLRSKRKLAELLYVSLPRLQALIHEKPYKEWLTKSKYPNSTHKALAHKPREIQQPEGLLREVQQRLNNLLSRLDLPDYLHSARKGRSYRSNAAEHQGPGSAFRIDIRKFYQSVHDRQVMRFFHEVMECSPDVSHILVELTCFKGHLPTGSSLSPVISFLAYQPMFDQLYTLAQSEQLKMTVYVDDIVISGVRARGALIPQCKRIIKDYGLKGHKVSLFKGGDVRVVTGVAIGPCGLTIPNKRRRKIRALQWELVHTTDSMDRARYKRALIGQYREGSALEPSFRGLALAVQ